MELNFRPLRAEEIECRIGTAKDGKGVSLLLYKDARCDMSILDETVGAMNWKREHTRDNANCIVSIWDSDKKMWISKEDTGTESNTEKEKGLASDSFKRSCTNWGIGRELYTSPFIWISGASKYDKFWVSDITIENKRITALTICRKDDFGNKTDEIAYQYPRKRRNFDRSEEKSAKSSNYTKTEKKSVRSQINAVETHSDNVSADNSEIIDEYSAETLKQMLAETNSDVRIFLDYVGKKTGNRPNSVDDMTKRQFEIAVMAIEQKKKKESA